MPTDILTVQDAAILGHIIECALAHQQVARLLGNGEIFSGVARNITDANGCRARGDIRDAYLHVTSMFEHFLPMREVMAEVAAGTIVLDWKDAPCPKR